MRQIFAHDASLRLAPGADPQAPGAAVTVEPCGHWEHEGPCRWPHLTIAAGRSGDVLALRMLFGADAGDEAEVRLRVVRALRRGGLEGGPRPNGWELVAEQRAAVRPDESPVGQRLVTR